MTVPPLEAQNDLLDLVESPEPCRTTERDMLDLLRNRYSRVRPGTDADRYVRVEHARLVEPGRPHYGKAKRIADLIVFDTYGMSETIGHEVKVSRSDWLAELRDPTKSGAWRRYCHRWFLVVPDAGIVRGDLPDGWGLMAPDATGFLRVRVRSKRFTPEPMSPATTAHLARSVAKTAARDIRAEADQ